MTVKDNPKTENVLSTTALTESSNQTRETYEKPTLAIVKFMFESDITWGSFDDNANGDNSVGGGSGNWWDDD